MNTMGKATRITLLAIATTWILSACATVESGRAFDSVAANAFVEGKSTRHDVETGLGPATTVSTNIDGTTLLIYSYVVGKGNGLTGKSTASGHTSLFQFDANGILVRKTNSQVNTVAK